MGDEDRNMPATKGDLLDLKAEVKGDLANLKDELIEAVRDGQTEVLRAFYGFSQTIQERFKEEDTTDAALRRRMGVLESRLLDIEKRLNMPPSGI